jgi:hypothetical protein
MFIYLIKLFHYEIYLEKCHRLDQLFFWFLSNWDFVDVQAIDLDLSPRVYVANHPNLDRHFVQAFLKLICLFKRINYSISKGDLESKKKFRTMSFFEKSFFMIQFFVVFVFLAEFVKSLIAQTHTLPFLLLFTF